MTSQVTLDGDGWLRGEGLVDPHGPHDVPFTPYDPANLERPILDVIAAVAQRRPRHIAIDDGTLRIDYQRLYGLACRLGQAIHDAGLPPGPIGVKVAYDSLHPLAILGCLAAGRPLLLLDPDNPESFNDRVARAAGLAGLIVNATAMRHTSSPQTLPNIAIESVVMTGIGAVPTPPGRVEARDPAFIVSTSGSTGAPKLVIRDQHRLHWTVRANIEFGHYNETDRLVTLGALTNGLTITRNLEPLLFGATVQMINLKRAGIGPTLQMIRDHRVSVVRTTVSILKTLSEFEGARAYLDAVRLVAVGGEGFLQHDLAQIRSVLPAHCHLGYVLWMTETPVARWHLPARDDHDPIRVACGYLIPGVDIKVLHEDGSPCAIGEMGELLVRSASVAGGEIIDGRVVKDRFMADATGDNLRTYRTGDLVRVCPDGVLVCYGRNDRMVKVRGLRVEPAMIEAAMRATPGVKDAVAVIDTATADIRIYAVIVPNAGAPEDLAETVRNHARGAVPSHMVPTTICSLPSLPMTKAGKIDYAAILAHTRAAAGVCDDITAAQN